MKNLLLSCGVAVIAAVSFSSCAKKDTCYKCEIKAGTITTTKEICNGKITTTVGTAASTTVDLPNGVNLDQQKKTFEAAGYTCKSK